MVSPSFTRQLVNWSTGQWTKTDINSVTSIQTVLEAFQVFLEDTTGMTGELLECSGTRLVFYPMPAPGNGRVTQRAVTVWEPLFRMMHGDDSRLETAIL